MLNGGCSLDHLSTDESLRLEKVHLSVSSLINSLNNSNILRFDFRELPMHSFGHGPHVFCSISANILSSKANENK